MRHWRRAGLMIIWNHGSGGLSQRCVPGYFSSRICLNQIRSSHHQQSSSPPDNPAGPEEKGGTTLLNSALDSLKYVGHLGQQWGRRSAQTAVATVNHWWGRYEELVGLNEVCDAQNKVTEAEVSFMVARGKVKEAHACLDAQQVKLKEVRHRLDRVPREDAQYLELATSEHRLLQEERRLRLSCENAEASEREQFSLFSAAVRESHEKERARAERTKNWSLIGSVLGALIGVMGSTYINRVRLQELKSLLLESKNGPESLQEVLREQASKGRSQQLELQTVIDSLRVLLSETAEQKHSGPQEKSVPITDLAWNPRSVLNQLCSDGQKTNSLIQSLQPQVGQLGEGISRLQSEVSVVRGLLESRDGAAQPQPSSTTETPDVAVTGEMPNLRGSVVVLEDLEKTQQTLGERISKHTVYNAILTYTASAITVSALYLLLRGPG